jgi:hypothetical protein
VDRLRAKVVGLRAKGKPLRAGPGRLQARVEGYAVLKVTGKGQGVDDLRKMLATRFARGARTPSTPVTPTQPVPA